MRVCTRCKEEKELSSFSRKGEGYQFTCKVCHSAYRKEHYERNRDKYINKAVANKKRYTDQYLLWLDGKSCVDCGNNDVRVLEQDHLGDKSFSIASKVGKRSISGLLDELEKCEIVCANCHRIRTIERGGWYRSNAVVV